ncbi:MAG: alpha-glucan family phosphorylase [Hydrogenobacter thermophilus]|uniref:alpha-glucan family phosphorylase n=1 Tax=Hydrogenobacter thermophilus TaxID=940 RepID=UPI001C796750|nr:alpha-glucan family phosphorylase [Hydrogenobacter thermophilus]QWK19490.1 MAG: alpha-glucan family phosphorylase [Hydrogenobacter thermophilus]
MIAYFVMELGLEDRIPTYSGGLGTLAGDTLYSFADLSIPAVCITLLYKKGYTLQKITHHGMQLDFDTLWDYKKVLTPLDVEVRMHFGDKEQKVRAWEYTLRGHGDIKVIFLDADIPGNEPDIRRLNERLYLDEGLYRLRQEMLLGIGGYRVLKALGYNISVYHKNESHSALLVVELLRELGDFQKVRSRCVFTTHTPVPAGHDKFPIDMVKQELKLYDHIDWNKEAIDGFLNLSAFALRYSCKVNAVSYKHMFVTKNILIDQVPTEGPCELEYVTNGVYHRRWIHPELQELFNEYMPAWDENPVLLNQVYRVPSELLLKKHNKVKNELVNYINKTTGAGFSDDVLTIGVARRVTAYKRNNLILRDIDRLIYIAEHFGELQIVFAGKAHPKDSMGKEMIADIFSKIQALKQRTSKVKAAFLENYSIDMAKLLVAGCDVWLNNPKRPYEACGTSGMKAAMNGVLNFSTWDGWWLEGGIEGINGWGIGPRPSWSDMSESNDEEDLEDIYGKLAYVILPMYYTSKDQWVFMMKNSIATVGPFFNTHRMVSEYISKVYQIGLR